MEKLPETIDMDPAVVERYIDLLLKPLHREDALELLNKERRSNKHIPLMLWNAKHVSFILLQEITKGYMLLSLSTLDIKATTRVCNAMALLQSMASHPDIKMKFVEAKMPIYLYPFMNTTEKGIKHLDYLRLTSLGVIGALVKEEDSNTSKIIHFLLESEVLPLCLQCINVGSELAKTVAAFVLNKLLLYEEGQRYCDEFPERCYAILNVLSNVVENFQEKPSSLLLKHILTCFMRLTEMPRSCDALTKCFPAKLRDQSYLNFICEDEAILRLAYQVLKIVTDGMNG